MIQCEFALEITPPAPAEPEPPSAYTGIVDRFIDLAEPLLVPNPNATLWEFQMSWYRVIEVADEVGQDVRTELRNLEAELKATSSRAEKQRIGRAMAPLKDAIHDLSHHAEALWIERIHQPIADTFAAMNPDDDESDWFFQILSEDRACEIYGTTTLPNLMQLAVQK